MTIFQEFVKIDLIKILRILCMICYDDFQSKFLENLKKLLLHYHSYIKYSIYIIYWQFKFPSRS